MKYKYEIISESKCELGEGLYYNQETNIIYWLDISKSMLYAYCNNISAMLFTKSLPNNPSVIFYADLKTVHYADRLGLKKLFLETDSIKLCYNHPNHDYGTMRANDGVILDTGQYIYGTMYDNPSLGVGKIYISSSDVTTDCLELDVAIPNTFIDLGEHLLISDSKKREIYSYPKKEIVKEKQLLWAEFKDKDYTPDGGSLSERGYVHIALWGGASIIVMNKCGEVVSRVNIPALNPTNCVLVSNRWLFVTSSYEEHSNEDNIKFPLSGHTFKIDLGESYEF